MMVYAGTVGKGLLKQEESVDTSAVKAIESAVAATTERQQGKHPIFHAELQKKQHRKQHLHWLVPVPGETILA